MNGESDPEMDKAWAEYLVRRDESGQSNGWNPRKVFEEGWRSAVVRSSGWYSGRE